MHKLHLSVVGEFGCAFSRIFHITTLSVLLSFSFQMCSISDVADDLWLSLKLDVCWIHFESTQCKRKPSNIKLFKPKHLSKR